MITPEEAIDVLNAVPDDRDLFGAEPGSWVELASSNLSAIAVDPDRKFVLVRFRNNAVYRYRTPNAPEHIEEIRRVPSPGRYFQQHLRHLPTERFTPATGEWMKVG